MRSASARHGSRSLSAAPTAPTFDHPCATDALQASATLPSPPPPPPSPPATTAATAASVATLLYTYNLYAGPLTWSAAQAFCVAQGGWLATFKSAPEYTAAMTAAVVSAAAALDWGVWFGLSDAGSSMNWTFVDGVQASWGNWDPMHQEQGGKQCALSQVRRALRPQAAFRTQPAAPVLVRAAL